MQAKQKDEKRSLFTCYKKSVHVIKDPFYGFFKHHRILLVMWHGKKNQHHLKTENCL